jgi:prepilin-type N-terminal cleavage/methylation domain-containing protein
VVSGKRGGFTLVEVIVALPILAVGVLGAAATFALAARLLREAEARSGAVGVAGSTLDSLLLAPRPLPGERHEGRYHLRWSTRPAGGATAVELEVEYQDGSASRQLRFEAIHAAHPWRIGGGE